MRKTNSLSIAALLIALDIIFSRFLYLATPGNVDSFSLQFIPNALTGFLFGPLYAAVILVAGDILGMAVSSDALAFSFFTISAAAKGFLYGWMLHNKELTIKRIFLTFLLATVLLDIGVDSIRLASTGDFAWQALVLPRLITRSVFVVAQTVLFSLISTPVSNRL